jgi:hypothetical protein
MKSLTSLKRQLKPGHVYRRNEVLRWSTAPDRHLAALVDDGTLQKLSGGVYYYPKDSVFGKVPPSANALVRSFLKDDRFLLTSPNAYNELGVGTSQLYNHTTVYNHKRHGLFNLGNRRFDFRLKHHFPKKLSPAFLLVDLVNNLDTLAEEPDTVIQQVTARLAKMDTQQIAAALKAYGNLRAKKILTPLLKLK